MLKIASGKRYAIPPTSPKYFSKDGNYETISKIGFPLVRGVYPLKPNVYPIKLFYHELLRPMRVIIIKKIQDEKGASTCYFSIYLLS